VAEIGYELAIAAYPPLNGGRNQSDSKELSSGIPQYVGFETPDGQYMLASSAKWRYIRKRCWPMS
jgi:hypothetical protein